MSAETNTIRIVLKIYIRPRRMSEAFSYIHFEVFSSWLLFVAMFHSTFVEKICCRVRQTFLIVFLEFG